jgi:hypothetical protein
MVEPFPSDVRVGVGVDGVADVGVGADCGGVAGLDQPG